ncbi:MAG: carbohydrate kinase family protein [Bradymonadia bacterium]
MILVGGENLMDMIQMPADGTDTVFRAVPGGSPYNVALALGRQGIPTGYLTPISSDGHGVRLAERLSNAGVKLLGGRPNAPTSLAVVTLQGGLPTYAFYREGTAERQLCWDRLREAVGPDIEALHLGSFTFIEESDSALWSRLQDVCGRSGIALSFDPNIRPSLVKDEDRYRACITQALRCIDVLKLSDEDLSWLYPSDSEEGALNRLVESAKAAVIVLTRGAEGASVYHQNQWYDQPADQVIALVDTVGAGDTFMASMLSWLSGQGLLKKLYEITLEQKLDMIRFAGRAAAINCGRNGCDPPSSAELRADHR